MYSFIHLYFPSKSQIEVDEHTRSNRNSEVCGKIYSDLDYIDASQSEDFNAFKKATADPVWTLRLMGEKEERTYI